MQYSNLVDRFKKIITDKQISWVVFKNGTCVMLLKPEADLKLQAINTLREHD